MEIIKRMVDGVGSAALLLAMTKSLADEQAVKQLLMADGYIIAVTELGGQSSKEDFQTRMIKSIVGAVLNNGVIKKEPYEIHAVLHAAMEAKKGIFLDMASSSNIASKIAIVRKDTWVAVAIFGKSALYHMTNHERAGLGVMHI